MGFALIWHIWWMVGAGFVGAFATFVVFAWRDRREYVIPADEVARIDRANRRARERRARAARRLEMRGRRRRQRQGDRYQTGQPHSRNARGHGAGMPPSASSSGYGFWIFLLSDIIMFSAFFATYAVLSDATAGGPTGADLFDLRNVAIETACLLLSSFTCGIASIGVRARAGMLVLRRDGVTFVLGAIFLGLELHEFVGMIEQGAGPDRSAFLSAFFTLVGCHGLHVTVGLLWLLTMMAQVFAKGYRDDILRRVLCFSLFWHALDIIWVALFTVVYLMGVGA